MLRIREHQRQSIMCQHNRVKGSRTSMHGRVKCSITSRKDVSHENYWTLDPILPRQEHDYGRTALVLEKITEFRPSTRCITTRAFVTSEPKS